MQDKKGDCKVTRSIIIITGTRKELIMGRQYVGS